MMLAGNGFYCFLQARKQDSWEDIHSDTDVLTSIQTKEGLKLLLVRADVLHFSGDVIVNTVPRTLQLGGGPLSRVLLKKAGPNLQKELKAKTQKAEEKVGSIFVTSGYDLDYQAVIHVVAPGWDNGAGSSWQIMAKIIRKCLKTVEEQSFASITFPMIATGNLRFPKAIFAELILSEVCSFSSSAQLNTLQEVHFLVHPSDDESCQAFLDEFTKWLKRNPNKDRCLMVGDNQGIFGTVSNPAVSTYEMKIGAITFRVAIGDITKEKVDVIVNSTTKTFNLKLGVSKAILEGAGPAVENECAWLAARPHRDFIITQGGYLKCKIIMHVLGENNVRDTTSTILEECEQRKHRSVCLPAIGTGNAGQLPIQVADGIISATEDFAKKHSTPSLKSVKVVIFLPKLLDVFYENMKKREPSMPHIVQPTFSNTALSGHYRQTCIKKSSRSVEYNLLSTDFPLEEENEIWGKITTIELEENGSEIAGGGEIPDHWTDMNQQLFCVIPLHRGQSEYTAVKDKFSQISHSFKIRKIERIQNQFLWQSYQVKKKQMDIKNGHTNNEKLLFHGTDAASVPQINQRGFNRSFAGKNAACYGKGTYFAVDASYSANDKYSIPDSKGRKHIYVVRVLTGDYTHGQTGMLTPPSKNFDNTKDTYDSVTDDINQPKLFVIFSDYQAYPEYLVTMSKR
ncbi:protein mono-ADP-ribosyltransferase PARP15 [Phacochoerus africanus]|uniref:protein mono-ADP-ribosyltransferase PARP15 n=1 Tax=Phacochoerus africanus TaxID=41426 RepID=UPI001FD9B513|nr:protein mono-ADP-ribosyltransferase PARP15 [Phacochoerus africanus]